MARATLTQTVLSVPDITWDHCEQVITAALASVDGVEFIAVDIPAQRVRVDYDPARVNLDRIGAILADEEYPVASMEGDQSPASDIVTAPIAGCSCCSSST